MSQFILIAVLVLALFGRKYLARLSDMLLMSIALVLMVPALVMGIVALREGDWINAVILAGIVAMAVWMFVPALRSRLKDLSEG